MGPDLPLESAPTWCARLADGDDVWSGPAPSFGAGLAATHRVSLLAADALAPPGRGGTPVEVQESGAGTFVVVHHDFGRWTGVWHPVGCNWLLVSDGGTRWAVTAGSTPAQSWVHIRFVLRHLVTAHLLARAGAQVVHAVAATHRRPHIGAVAVLGPSRTGKTRLVNRLVAAGVLGEVVEDDCGVVVEGSLAGLFPTEHELRQLHIHPLAAVVALDDRVDAVADADRVQTASWAARCPVPWPAGWLPGTPSRPSRPVPLLAGTACFVVPPRRQEDPVVLGALRERLESLPIT